MRSRILATVIGLTTLAVAVFFVAAATFVRRSEHAALARELEREAALAAAGLPPGDPSSGVLPDDKDHQYGLYDRAGRRVTGSGPDSADRVVKRAFNDRVYSDDVGSDYVAAVPVAVRNGTPTMVLRVAEPASQATDAIRRKLFRLSFAAVAIVGLAAGVGWRLVRRLVRPLDQLQAAAARFGRGELDAGSVGSTGLAELDQVGDALGRAAGRIGDLLERERRFSADVSHQLRTPLAGIRVAVEAELEAPRADPTTVLNEVLAATDELESTVLSLLALARDTSPERSPEPLGPIISAAATRWEPRFAAAGRRISVLDVPDLPVAASPAAVAQCLDVLFDNALRHGRGTVEIRAERSEEHLSVRVADEGTVRTPGDALFHRRRPQADGTGIGLHLGRSLARAEGGDLRLAAADPACFELDLVVAVT